MKPKLNKISPRRDASKTWIMEIQFNGEGMEQQILYSGLWNIGAKGDDFYVVSICRALGNA
jgi:hypothetical protein